MTHGREELLVGSVIIVSLVGAAVGTLWLKGTRFGNPVTRIDVLAREVGQVMEGNEVTLRGVSIGRVGPITVEPDGRAVRLELRIEGNPTVPEDPVVVLAPESLFGDWQAEIVARDRYERFDYYEVPPGTTENGVPVLGAYALPDITRLTATAQDVSENLAGLTERVDRAFNEETAANLQAAIGNIQQVSEDIKNLIQQQATTFGDVSGHVREAAEQINAAARVARSTLESADRILGTGQVDTLLANLSKASRNFDDIANDLGRATSGLDSTLTHVDSAFSRIDRVTAQVESGQGALGMLLADTALVLRAQGVLAELDALLKDVRENPSRYVRLSIF
ncbi:MAG TPA: MlaD family protein [Longimicrobiales bacterium]|nr:MlaD family protein [Longimicrobiales bacterium]